MWLPTLCQFEWKSITLNQLTININSFKSNFGSFITCKATITKGLLKYSQTHPDYFVYSEQWVRVNCSNVSSWSSVSFT